MKSIKDQRRENLRLLLAEYKTQRELSEATGLDKSYISQMLGGYSIGEKTARKIEQSVGKPELWMDTANLLSAKHMEVIRRVQEFPEDDLHILSAFLDSLSAFEKEKYP